LVDVAIVVCADIDVLYAIDNGTCRTPTTQIHNLEFLSTRPVARIPLYRLTQPKLNFDLHGPTPHNSSSPRYGRGEGKEERKPVMTTAIQKALTTFLEESGAGFENAFITPQK
jgi:hypothetical protein